MSLSVLDMSDINSTKNHRPSSTLLPEQVGWTFHSVCMKDTSTWMLPLDMDRCCGDQVHSGYHGSTSSRVTSVSWWVCIRGHNRETWTHGIRLHVFRIAYKINHPLTNTLTFGAAGETGSRSWATLSLVDEWLTLDTSEPIRSRSSHRRSHKHTADASMSHTFRGDCGLHWKCQSQICCMKLLMLRQTSKESINTRKMKKGSFLLPYELWNKRLQHWKAYMHK